MISSVLLRAVLTVVFAATAGYALLRWASLRAGVAGRHGDQVAELFHLLMGLSMIAMIWAYGGPGTDLVQVVLFSTLGAYFLLSWVGAGRIRMTPVPGCPAAPYHLLMSAAMVWMVAAMALLMGGTASGGAGAMPDMPDMPGMAMTGASATHMAVMAMSPPAWATGVSALVLIALGASALYWARRLVRTPGRVMARELVPAGGTGTGTHPTTPANRIVAALTPRSDAACHCAMSLAMAASFLPML